MVARCRPTWTAGRGNGRAAFWSTSCHEGGVKASIRVMTREDIPQVGEILYLAFNAVAAKHGYDQRIQSLQAGHAWARAIFVHAPRELLVAGLDHRVVGVCCLSPRGEIGGVGPVAVHPQYQGHHIGRELMNALVERAGGLTSLRLFQEAFNPASFFLYYSMGFLPVAHLLNLASTGETALCPEPCKNVDEASEKDLNALGEYDVQRSKLDRRGDLAHYVKWGKVLVYRAPTIRGFLACLAGSGSVQLGPLLAEGSLEAQRLFRHAVAAFAGRPCRTRVMARDVALVRALSEFGFRLSSIDTLMVRGSWIPGNHLEGFGAFPESV